MCVLTELMRCAAGVCAGMLEAFSYVVRMFSGVISDKMTSRKAAITAGFAMGAMAKFGMSGAVTTVQLFVTKAIDRLGNGVQVSDPEHAKPTQSLCQPWWCTTARPAMPQPLGDGT